jgi:nitrile hydratase accessory protein
MTTLPDDNGAAAAAAGEPRAAALAMRPHEPTFAEPWQAHAFALVVQLHERGLFGWREWADALAQQIARAQAAGDADRGDTYYHHWLAALEALAAAKGLTSSRELARYASAWDHAAGRTPHGRPIELEPGDFDAAGGPAR